LTCASGSVVRFHGLSPAQHGGRISFSAIIGQDEMKLAILIAAIDPSLGGVLVFGERGTGKSTAVRDGAGARWRNNQNAQMGVCRWPKQRISSTGRNPRQPNSAQGRVLPPSAIAFHAELERKFGPERRRLLARTEYVPLALLLLAMAELRGLLPIVLHALCVSLTVGRLLHAWDVSRSVENLSFRVAGIAFTLTSIGGAALSIILS
jgi:uncharacterized membrane protein YecN with MAPEG domain